jgi:hypothetical protein
MVAAYAFTDLGSKMARGPSALRGLKLPSEAALDARQSR